MKRIVLIALVLMSCFASPEKALSAECTYHAADATVRVFTDESTLDAVVAGLAERGWTRISDRDTSQALIVHERVRSDRVLEAKLGITSYVDRSMWIASKPSSFRFPRRHDDHWKRKMDRRRHAALLASLESFPSCPF